MESSDARLVADSLTGNREAFGQIVGRYQSLICSLAYSGTGNLSQSEDLAQDTFISAWKQLATLREPEKLRSWLCAIARHRICDTLKRQGREPSHAAESLDAVHESPAPEPPPHDLTISKEEAAILWRSIERIPEIYREPLILFYREHQAIEVVAEKLELTEDNVKQRLSRGRKMLHDEVLAFVEGALARTNPGKVFTLAVLAALPSLAISAKAATLGASAAKGTIAVKAMGLLGLCGALLSSVIGFFGLWIGYRSSMDAARSERERGYTRRTFKRLTGCIVAFMVICAILMFCGAPLVPKNHLLFVSLVIGLALAYIAVIAGFSLSAYRSRKKLLAELTPAEIATRPTEAIWEYRSRFHLLGLPFVHVRIGDRLGEPLKAWIAAGDCAFGVLFAFGGLAVAPISVGGCTVGLFTFGGLAMGALVIGGFGFGVWALGGLAIGWQAIGGCAIAWNAAWGGYAIAHQLAVGGLTSAPQANTELANHVMMANPFFSISTKLLPYFFWCNLFWFIPLLIQQRVIKRQRRLPSQKSADL